VTGEELEFKSYSTNLNVFEDYLKMNFESVRNLIIGDKVFFWVLLSPNNLLNITSLSISSNFMEQKSLILDRKNHAFTLNGTLNNIPKDEFTIQFPNLDVYLLSLSGNGDDFVWSFSGYFLGSNDSPQNVTASQSPSPSHLNPQKSNPTTWILAISISILISVGISIYYLRRRYLDRKFENQRSSFDIRSNGSTIEAEYDDDSYTLHSQSTISTTPSQLTFS
jgi:hypothetical protein